MDTGSESRGGQWLLLLSGLLLLLYTTNSAQRALRLIHVIAWRERPRHARLVPSILVGLLLIGMFVVGAGTSALAARFPDGVVGTELVLAGLLGAVWLLISWLLPHADAPWRALLPGAGVMAVGLGVMELVSVIFLARKLNNSSQLYGGLGVAAAVMAWLFFSCRLVVAAAELNARLWQRGLILGGRGDASAGAIQPAEPTR
ncbi:MAG: YihY/virulence factor BrkB family protein [Candidatus Dormibacteraeota bacterium]|nr:YihY/virulence factor BrkB family protein [Candidatus Dormibacteraeota bacterium]